MTSQTVRLLHRHLALTVVPPSLRLQETVRRQLLAEVEGATRVEVSVKVGSSPGWFVETVFEVWS